MSSDEIVIQANGLGKRYEIYRRPQDRLKQIVLPSLQRALGRSPRDYFESFWALKEISFEVKRGETIGILGQNGSGKSTLLQVISGILQPTEGSVEVKGRVGALIELGSGFNPEFTGRENVFLNGSLLGLSQNEIEQRFDKIAAFADIGEHIERAVKTYSSGMMLRLAFAVQMAVEPEILIIDEAMAVGDARFQLKCFKKLDELKANGTTILFVSHAIETVRSFCDTGIVLDYGRLQYLGDAKTATVQYLSILYPNENNQTEQNHIETEYTQKIIEVSSGSEINPSYILQVSHDKLDCDAFGAGGAWLDDLKIYGIAKPNLIIGQQEIVIRTVFSWDQNIISKLINEGKYENNIAISIALADKKGNYIFGCNGFDYGMFINCLENNTANVEFKLNIPELIEGDYFITVAIPIGKLSHHLQLVWYDYAIPLKIYKSEKNVFGLIAVDYQMKLLSNIENDRGKICDTNCY